MEKNIDLVRFLGCLCFSLNLGQRQKMGEGERFQLGTVGALTLSVVSSVSIVICNKALISSLGFTFGKFLMTVFLWFECYSHL